MIRPRLLLPASIAVALTLVSALAFVRAAEITAGTLRITAAWARATPPGARTGAAYITVENRGAAADRLLGATSPAARALQLHETVEENGVAKMRAIQAPPVPAGAALEMQPGGTHIMLVGLTGPLKVGDTVPVTLTFETAGPVTMDLVVAPIGAEGPVQAHHAH